MEKIDAKPLYFAVRWYDMKRATPAFHAQFLSQAYNVSATGTRILCIGIRNALQEETL